MDLLIKILIYVLEGIFALGLFGCVFVLILATIDDIKVLVHRDPKAGPSPALAEASQDHAPAGLAPAPLHPQAR